ncbi:PAS domain S-box protein [Dehalococcoides mccartyi]|uniref:PAS domain S-box protein n=1 Tax=Dehalococcoides mccartyi TaxID=61435 RepID=UPI0002B769FF|nr:PAS domain S-box protein [Dehalococcoides mccartyi]AGG06602.1 PAS/PAC sensor signal transduction histidine kinase [Dehalococcoides mccartyi DCMB5]
MRKIRKTNARLDAELKDLQGNYDKLLLNQTALHFSGRASPFAPSQILKNAPEAASDEIRQQNTPDAKEICRRIIETAYEGVILTDANGRITLVNPCVSQITGYSSEVLHGKTIFEMVSKAHLATALAQWEKHKKGTSARYELQLKKSNGRLIWVVFSVSVPFGQDTDFNGILATVTDISMYKNGISERKKLFKQAALHDKKIAEMVSTLERDKQSFQSIMDNTTTQLAFLDRDFNFIKVNQAYMKNCGHTEAELIGANHFALFPSAENEAIFRRVIKTGKPVEFCDKPFEYPDQPWRGITYWDWSLVPIKNSRGRVQGLVFSLIETTVRKQMEIALKFSLEETRRRTRETAALLDASRAILEHSGFKEAAMAVYSSCKKITSCQSGFVGHVEGGVCRIIYFDSTKEQPKLPLSIPLAGLALQASQGGKTVLENDFKADDYYAFLPANYLKAENALFAPVRLGGRSVGLLALFNKAGGFGASDIRVASSFGALAAIAFKSNRTRQMLEESEKRYRFLFNGSGDAVFVHYITPEGKTSNFIEVNEVACQRLGYSRQELLNMSPCQIDDPVFTGLSAEVGRKLKEEGRVITEQRHLCRDGTFIPVELNIQQFELGGKLMVISVARDITERKKADAALKMERDKLLGILDAMEDGVYIVNADYEIEYVNPPLMSQFGAIEGKKCYDYFHHSNIPCEYCKNKEVLSGQTVRWEWHSPYNQRDYELMATPVKNPDGTTSKLTLFHDVTERSQMEQIILRYQAGLLAQAERIAHIGNWDYDLLGHSLLLSDETYNILGLSPANGIPNLKQIMEIFHTEDRDMVRVEAQKAMVSGSKINIEHRIIRPDGHLRYVHDQAEIILSDTGVPLRVLGTVQDVTERKLAEEALRDSERRYRLLADNMVAFIWTIDEHLNTSYLSPSIIHLLNYYPEDILGKHISMIFTSESYEKLLDVYQQVRKTGSELIVNPLELEVKRQDGKVIITDTLMRPLYDENYHFLGILGASRDISERKAAEYELHTLSQRLVELQEEERATIARELHDQVGQSLTVLKLMLDKAKDSLPDRSEKLLAEAQPLVSELISSVRNMSLDLRPRMLDDLGLLPALLWYFDRFSSQTGINVNFQHAGLKRKFSPQLGTAVYRIIQEALTNVVRYAGVDHVLVRARADKNQLALVIQDSGKGFNPAQRATGMSSGLKGMKERVRFLGGKLDIESKPGEGTHIIVEFPLNEEMGRINGGKP